MHGEKMCYQERARAGQNVKYKYMYIAVGLSTRVREEVLCWQDADYMHCMPISCDVRTAGIVLSWAVYSRKIIPLALLGVSYSQCLYSVIRLNEEMIHIGRTLMT